MLSQRRRARDQRRRVRRRSSTPSSASATTCGSAAGCRPTRGWPSAARRVRGRRTRCPTCGPASCRVFRDYGYRRLRHKARLKFLLADWGTGEVPPGAGERVPRAAAARRPGAAAAAGPRRPRRRAPRRRTAASTSAPRPIVGRVSGPTAAPARRPRRGARLDSRAADRRTRSSWSSTSRAGPRRVPRRGPRRARAAGRAEPHPPRHDRLHRHRVLQARDRRDQGHATAHRAELEERLADIIDRSHADLHPRQRLPQLLRPHPDRRHRPQGPARHDDDGKQVPGYQVHLGGGARAATSRLRPQGPRPEGRPPTSSPTTSSAWSRKFVGQTASRTRRSRPWAHRADEEAAAYERRRSPRLDTASPSRGLPDEERDARLDRHGSARRLEGASTAEGIAAWARPQTSGGDLIVAASMAATRSCRTWSRPSCRAWTCCSSTPATTSPRRCRPATRSRSARCRCASSTCCREQSVAEQDAEYGAAAARP